ncbi:MAG: PqqD family protein [Pseudomonadota bacterium]
MKFQRSSASILQTEVDSGLALLDPETHTYFLLNKTGAVIWDKLQGEVSLDEICTEVASQFEVSEEGCKNDVRALLDTMAEKGFLEAHDEGSV